MSRTRIVKGKITEIIGGDLCYFSETDIVEYGAETYIEQSASGIHHSGAPNNPPPISTLAKCVVFFRPTKDWKGEFGFDWVRVRDSKLESDFPYDGIIGSYGSKYATQDGAVFTPNSIKYKGILKEYNSFHFYKGMYYVPNMTLKKGESATLDAIVHVKEKADKLHYAYNTDLFELTILKKFTVSKGVNHDESSVVIKCKKEFSSSETIRVIATKDNKMEKVGEIKLMPNSSKTEVKVLIIPVNYNSNRGDINGEAEVDYVNNVLRQSLIDVKIEYSSLDFKIGSWWSDLFFTTKDKNGNKVMDQSSMRSLHKYLDDSFMEKKSNSKYSSYYRVYCLPKSLNLNGVAEDIGNGAKALIVFQNRNNPTTLVHELLHCMGLYHTFDNNSKYTFKLYNTDNVMDYSHQVGRKRFTSNKFQWKILNKSIS